MDRFSSLLAPLLLGVLACGSGRKNAAALPQMDQAGAGSVEQGGASNGNAPAGGAPDHPEDDVDSGGATVAPIEGGAPTGGGGGGVESPVELSQFCGDAIRDPLSEACDDGPGAEEDSCSPECETRNLLVVGGDRTTRLSRRLGFGRHPLVASASGAAVVFTETEGSSATLRLARFNALGQRVGEPLPISAGLKPGDASNPVVAALPDDRYVAAWGDLSEGSLDVVFRPVSAAGVLGNSKRANATTTGAQFDPDLIWTNNELTSAWTDGFAVKARTFSSELEPTSAEQTLSTSAFAGHVTLAAHGTSWAAAFRESADGGGEQIAIVLADETRFLVGPFNPGPTDQRPALVSLDDQHLLLVFGATLGGVPRLAGAIVDVEAPALPVAVSLEPALAPYNLDSTLEQRRPALCKVGGQIFLAWQTSSPLGDPLDQELFLRELHWSASAPEELGLSDERSLLLDWAGAATQQAPVLAASGSGQGDTLLSAFEHAGLLPDSKVAPDLVFGFVPWPNVKAPTSGASP